MTTQPTTSITDIADILQAVRDGLEKANEIAMNNQEWYLLAVLRDTVTMTETRQKLLT